VSHTIHAFDFLAAPDSHSAAATTVLFGDVPFLKSLVLHEFQTRLAADEPFATYEGDKAEWRDIVDELCTRSLFGGDGPRLVVVREADPFVSAQRNRLEDYVAQPGEGVLLLEVNAWASNTKLYKSVDKQGLQIDCRAPRRGKYVDEGKVREWLQAWSQSRHRASISSAAAKLLMELQGAELGLLDQSLAKLALFAGDGGKISPEMVRDIVGGWKTNTVWELIDHAADGDAAEALRQLDRLVQAGEEPIALLAQLASNLRKYAAATQIFADAERSGSRISLKAALLEAGFRNWPSDAIAKSESRLKQLGRERAGAFYRWTLDLDLALKGSHSHKDRARLMLEMLFIKMSKHLSPRRRRTT